MTQYVTLQMDDRGPSIGMTAERAHSTRCKKRTGVLEPGNGKWCRAIGIDKDVPVFLNRYHGTGCRRRPGRGQAI
eukprot:COSAG01_NODE_40959_length_457_cov_1.460894_1_plen_74_part_10